MRRLRTGVALASLLACGLVACQLIVGVKDDDGAPRPDAATAEAGEPSAPCILRKPPVRPTTGGGTGKVDFVYYALDGIVIAPSEDAGPEPVIGFDLDNHCTGLPTTPPSTLSDPSCAAPDGGRADDEDGGVDNSLRRIFGALPLKSSDPDPGAAFFNKAIRGGTRTMLIALGDYDGLPDDGDVNVALFASEGLLPSPDGGGPARNGKDEWTHTGATRFLPGGPEQSVKGYVTGSILVTWPVDLVVALGGFSFTLHEASLTATIDSSSDPGRLIDGTITGRVVANELLEAAGQIPIGGMYCALSLFTSVPSTICRSVDLVPPGSTPGAACDSVSVGIGFSAVRALARDVIKDASAEACAPLTCAP